MQYHFLLHLALLDFTGTSSLVVKTVDSGAQALTGVMYTGSIQALRKLIEVVILRLFYSATEAECAHIQVQHIFLGEVKGMQVIVKVQRFLLLLLTSCLMRYCP